MERAVAEAQHITPAARSSPRTPGLTAWDWLASPAVTAGSPALLVQGDAVNAAVGTEDVKLPGLGQQLHVPHLVGAPVHGLGGKAEKKSSFYGTQRGGGDGAACCRCKCRGTHGAQAARPGRALLTRAG